MRTAAVLIAGALLAVASGSPPQRAPDAPCKSPIPAGARLVPRDPNFDPWGAPWVFSRRQTGTTALTSLRKAGDTLPIALDDGSRGTLQVERHPCAPMPPAGAAPDECSPRDCGCISPGESYFIVATNSSGAVVSRLHLWAAYNDFEVVPVDLIDGPGDELVVVRTVAHGSPRMGNDLKIWKLGEGQPSELLQPDFSVGAPTSTFPFACVFWRTDAVVDLSQPKPRSIQLRGRVDYRPPCCLESDDDVQELRTVLRGQVLRFTNDTYSVR